jgi:hypothetical protein
LLLLLTEPSSFISAVLWRCCGTLLTLDMGGTVPVPLGLGPGPGLDVRLRDHHRDQKSNQFRDRDRDRDRDQNRNFLHLVSKFFLHGALSSCNLEPISDSSHFDISIPKDIDNFHEGYSLVSLFSRIFSENRSNGHCIVFVSNFCCFYFVDCKRIHSSLGS